jgi:hypothetical protein
VAQRLMRDNVIIYDEEILLTPSSEEPTFPALFLKDQSKQKPWRTKFGWTIVAGFNDKIDVNRTGVGNYTVTLTAGTYATGGALATHLTARFEAADATPVWDCLYNTGTKKFTIRNTSAHNFTLRWANGPNTVEGSSCLDLGFSVAADLTGAASYAAPDESYQSRHFLLVNKSVVAGFPVHVCAIMEHNATLLGSSATEPKIYLQAHGTIPFPANTAPTISDEFLDLNDINALDDPNVPCVLYPTIGSYEYWRLMINDVQNPAGYFELGALFMGIYLDTTTKISDDPTIAPEDFSRVSYSVDGTAQVDIRRHRNVWTVNFKFAALDVASLRNFFNNLAIGEHFLIDFDSGTLGAHTLVRYGFFDSRPVETYRSTLVVSFQLIFKEAL